MQCSLSHFLALCNLPHSHSTLALRWKKVFHGVLKFLEIEMQILPRIIEISLISHWERCRGMPGGRMSEGKFNQWGSFYRFYERSLRVCAWKSRRKFSRPTKEKFAHFPNSYCLKSLVKFTTHLALTHCNKCAISTVLTRFVSSIFFKRENGRKKLLCETHKHREISFFGGDWESFSLSFWLNLNGINFNEWKLKNSWKRSINVWI